MAADNIQTLEERCYSANKASIDLLSGVKDLELEVDGLKSYIVDLKTRIAVYVPANGDSIDKKLADFINSKPHN